MFGKIGGGCAIEKVTGAAGHKLLSLTDKVYCPAHKLLTDAVP
jgi:hypothetical protein